MKNFALACTLILSVLIGACGSKETPLTDAAKKKTLDDIAAKAIAQVQQSAEFHALNSAQVEQIDHLDTSYVVLEHDTIRAQAAYGIVEAKDDWAYASIFVDVQTGTGDKDLKIFGVTFKHDGSDWTVSEFSPPY